MKQLKSFLPFIVGAIIGTLITYHFDTQEVVHRNSGYVQLEAAIQDKFGAAYSRAVQLTLIPVSPLKTRQDELKWVDSAAYYQGRYHAFLECESLINNHLKLKP